MDWIEAVLFDWGGVLIDDPAPGLMAFCARALGVSMGDYTRTHNRHGEPFQKGLIEEATFWQRGLRRPEATGTERRIALGTGPSGSSLAKERRS